MNLKVTEATFTHLATVRRLAFLCLLGIMLYVALDVLLYVLRSDLPILRHAESDYGNGPYAWIMDVNFLLRCVLSLAAAGALWYALPGATTTRIAAVLLVVWALASGILALFPDDFEGAPVTAHGRVHLAAAAIAFFSCLLATLLFTEALARLRERWSMVITLAVLWLIAAIGLFLLTTVGFKPHGLDGLYERIFLGAELLWLAVAMGTVYRGVDTVAKW